MAAEISPGSSPARATAGFRRFLPTSLPAAIVVVGCLVAAAFGAGASTAYLLMRSEVPESSETRLPGGLTRPLLECDVPSYRASGPRPLAFHVELRAFVQEVEARAGIRQVAVYFRDLDNGPWIGIREKMRFTPASLYKVPLVIAALKMGVGNPAFWQQTVEYPGPPQPELMHYRYRPEKELVPGARYGVADLLERTILYSDNAAAWLLTKTVGQEAVDGVLRDLGIDPAEVRGTSSTLSAEEFGRFFRVLYNASYLPDGVSEAALQLLARVTFREGLVAGVPAGVTVAHKFGEKFLDRNGVRSIQLHDCGIVYHPKRPYLLCVMTLGMDYDAQAAAIRDVAAFVNDQVTQRTLEPGP